MDKFIKSWILLVLSIQVNCVFGKEAFRVEEPNMPKEIVECNSVAEVKPYLSSKEQMIRIWAVRRIGQFKTQEAVQELVAGFEKEKREMGMDISPTVGQEIIHALGDIGGEQVKVTLLGILQKYLDEGPKTKRYAWQDQEYMRIVKSTLEELGRWKDADILNTFEKLFLDERLPLFIREKAYGQHLAIKMQKEGIIGLEKEMNYLLRNLKSRGEGHPSDWVKGKDGVKTFEAIRNHAIFRKLIEYGEPALPYIERELNKVPPTEKKRRHEALSQIKKSIKIISEREHRRALERKRKAPQQKTKQKSKSKNNRG